MKSKKLYLVFLLSLIVLTCIPLNLNDVNRSTFNDLNDGSATYSNEIQREWRVIWGGPEDEYGYGVAQDSEGFLYICGNTESYGAGSKDAFLVKYDDTGAVQWEQIWGGGDSDSFFSIDIIDTDLYVAARRGNTAYLVKYNSSGSLLWASSAGSGSFRCITHDTGGNFYLSGEKGEQFYLAKFNNTGTLMWTKEWGSSRPYEHISDITLDSSGNIYITGQSITSNLQISYAYVAKFNVNGTMVWEDYWRLDEFLYERVWARGIALDSFNNIFIVGGSSNAYDIILVKYNNSGHEEWYKFYDQEILNDYGSDIIIDNSGKMFILGTEKYLEVNNTGGILYSRGIGDNSFKEMLMDNDGNLYFIGTSYYGGDYRSCFDKWNRIPEIKIISPYPSQTFGNASFKFELSYHMANINTTWYSLNHGTNYTFEGTHGIINQEAWDLCNNGSVIITFYANNSEGRLAYNEIYVQKNIELDEIIVYSPNALQEFGRTSPIYEIYVPFANLDTIWYTFDNESYFECELNGTIDQTEWNTFYNGKINIWFYANNTESYIINKLITVIKNVILTPKRIFAIVIGIENYPGTDNDLAFCVDDANGVYNYLRIECNAKEENIIRLLDSSATYDAIGNAFLQLTSKMGTRDVLFFYYSGHGGNDGSNEFICPYDSLPSTPSNFFYDWMFDSYLDSNNCDEKYIIIDACNSGGVIPEAQGSGRFFMTACRDYEDSIETFELGHGVFTNFFLDSSQYAPDLNSDGVLSMEEQFPYTYDETVSYAAGLGHSQHPVQNDGISGSAILSPHVGAVSFDIFNNMLNYNFSIYGSGHIITLNLSICSVSPLITTKTADLIGRSTSTTGFGLHSGTIQLDDDFNISGYELLIQIDGYTLKKFTWSFGDSDGDNLFDLIEIKVSHTNPLLNDTDSDGLDDYEEFNGLTDPLLNDTDHDTLLDGLEVNTLGTNPVSNDTDADGMDDGYEVYNGLDPLFDDSNLDLDGDGLSNLLEYQCGTIANNSDSDGDLMPDGYEYYHDLDLFNDDSGLDKDGDGLTNLFECNHGSAANNTDTDGDLMPDGWEYNNGLDFLTDDSNLDLDGDGLSNLLEYQCGGIANNSDSDGDLMPDGWEYYNGLNLTINDANDDNDSDFLTNINEFLNGTNPILNDTDNDLLLDGIEVITYGTNPLLSDSDYDDLSDYDEIMIYFTDPLSIDSDLDLMPDGWEVINNLNPLINDSSDDPDNDLLPNLQEYQNLTDPNNWDSDNDGWSDGDEVLVYDTDPLDPNDYPIVESSKEISGYEVWVLIAIFTSVLVISLKKFNNKVQK